ncbi:MAG TPA: hypothetical protein PK874_10480 [Desulfobacteraceae bacterium]|nr:hypothetical protein [Desulfobacteraceae bacterium]
MEVTIFNLKGLFLYFKQVGDAAHTFPTEQGIGTIGRIQPMWHEKDFILWALQYGTPVYTCNNYLMELIRVINTCFEKRGLSITKTL